MLACSSDENILFVFFFLAFQFFLSNKLDKKDKNKHAA